MADMNDGLQVMSERAEVMTLFSGEGHWAVPRIATAKT